MDSSRNPSSFARKAAAPLFVAAVTVLVFWPAVRGGFVNVDDAQFLASPYRGLGLASLRGMFTSFYFGNYVPLALLSLAVDAALWGSNPFGYHLTNVLWHAAGAAVFCLLVQELLLMGGSKAGDRAAAVAAALFFSLHPLRVQSVAWVAERRDVLCGFFFVLTLLLWLRSFRPGRLSGSRGKASALGAFLLALLSKSAAVPLPLVLILLDVWPLRRLTASPRRWGREPAVWLEKLPFIALAAVFAGLTAAAQAMGGSISDLASAAPLQRFNQIALNQVFYLGKLLWPTRLSFYAWTLKPILKAVVVGAVATAVLLACAVRSPRLRAPLLAALAYQTLMLAPTSGFVTIGHELVSDRYSYLSGLAWAALFGAGLGLLARRHRAASLAAACVLLGALSALTRAQIAVWKDSAALWRQMIRVDPVAFAARPMLAQALAADGRAWEAILVLDEHVRLFPEDAATRKTLDDLLVRTGATERDYAGFHERLGLEFAARGEFDKAAWHFERGLAEDPGSSSLRAELARVRQGSRRAAP